MRKPGKVRVEQVWAQSTNTRDQPATISTSPCQPRTFFLFLLQMVNGMVADMVADNEVDKVTDMVAGHGCWLIGPKLFRPEPYPACASFKLCKLIKSEISWHSFEAAI